MARKNHERESDEPEPTLSCVINRDRLAKVLALMALPVDGEVLVATRKAVKMLADFSLRPEDSVDGIPNPVEPIMPVVRWTYRPEPPPPQLTHKWRPKPPPHPTFRDLGAASARRVIVDILAAGNVSPRDVAFLREMSDHFYSEPHIGADHRRGSAPQ